MGTQTFPLQLVNDPQNAVHADTGRRGNLAQQSIAGQQDGVFMNLRRDEAHAVIGGQPAVPPFHREHLAHVIRWDIVGFQPGIVEHAPLLGGEVQKFGLTDRQGNKESVWQGAKDMQQLPFAQIYETGSIIDYDACH